MEISTIVILVIVGIIVISVMRSQKDKQAFESAKSNSNFNPDYVAHNKQISIESASKRIMLKRGKQYRVYNPDEISEWHTGYDSITSKNNVYYKYYIEFRVKDLDDPNPKAWFGGENQERDKWYSRVTTLFNG